MKGRKISRQLGWQQQCILNGRCPQCGDDLEKDWPLVLCKKCRAIHNTARRKVVDMRVKSNKVTRSRGVNRQSTLNIPVANSGRTQLKKGRSYP